MNLLNSTLEATVNLNFSVYEAEEEAETEAKAETEEKAEGLHEKSLRIVCFSLRIRQKLRTRYRVAALRAATLD